jgi:hypothetical protein
MRGEPFARWRTVFPFDAAEVRVNEDARPGVTDQVEVSRGGQRARYAVLSAADTDCDNCVGIK